MTIAHRSILPATLLVTTLTAWPSTAEAGCVGDYYTCLNDSWNTSGISRIMADIECFAGYVGCVTRKVMQE